MSRERFRFILILAGLVCFALLTSCNNSNIPRGVVLEKEIKGMPKGIAHYRYIANATYWMAFEDSSHFFMVGDTIMEIK